MSRVKCESCNWYGDKGDVESVQVSYKRDDPLDKCPECGLIESMLPLDEFEEKFLKVYLSFGGRVEDHIRPKRERLRGRPACLSHCLYVISGWLY